MSDRSTCAAFIKESRMKFASAINLDRNSGERSGGTCFSFIPLSIHEDNRNPTLCRSERTRIPATLHMTVPRVRLSVSKADLQCALPSNQGPTTELANPSHAILIIRATAQSSACNPCPTPATETFINLQTQKRPALSRALLLACCCEKATSFSLPFSLPSSLEPS